MSASQPQNRPKRKYRTHKAKMDRIMISVSDGLLKLVDDAAEKDFTTRSDIIRQAILWYLRPQGREFDQADPDAVLKTLQRRKVMASLREEQRQQGRYPFDLNN